MSRLLYVYDFSHEADIHESLIFYFVYFFIELYIAVSCVLIFFLFFDLSDLTLRERAIVEVALFLCSPSIVPCIFGSILSILILFRKKIDKKPIINLTAAVLLLTLLLPNVMGMFVGLIMPTILITQEDNSVEKYDKILKLQLAEHDRKIESQLEKERIIKELNKPEDLSNNIIHLELTPEVNLDKNEFHLFD